MESSLIRSILAVEERHWWFHGRRQWVSRLLTNHVAKPCGDVLEIGCGSGANFNILAEHGRLHAVEMDEASRIAANQREMVQVVDGRLPDRIPFEEGRFGLVALLDVIEHIEDDVEAMKSVRSHMAADGHVIVTVPAFNSLWSHHDDLNRHFRRYRRGGLTQVLQDSGLDVLYCGYMNFFLFPMFFAVRLMKRFKRRQDMDAHEITVPPGPVNWMLGAIFSGERLLVPWLRYPFGSSLVAVGRNRR